MNRLTHKQQAFAENVASGLTYTQAYREAYNCPTAKPKTCGSSKFNASDDQRLASIWFGPVTPRCRAEP